MAEHNEVEEIWVQSVIYNLRACKHTVRGITCVNVSKERKETIETKTLRRIEKRRMKFVFLRSRIVGEK